MSSIPYTVILTHKINVLPLSYIQEQQNFCKKFLKAQQTYEKYKSNGKSKITFVNENVFLYNEKDQKLQNQIDVLNWLSKLNQEERLSLFSLKNKWLINIFSQMFYIYYKMGNYNYKPLSEMCIFFNNQKNYLSKEENSNILQEYLKGILGNKNIEISENPSILELKEEKNKKVLENIEPEFDELNLLSTYYQINEVTDDNYIHSEKRKMEKKFIDNIRIICDKNDNYDTLTFTKDFIMNIENIKKFFTFFAGDNFFQDWLIPIN